MKKIAIFVAAVVVMLAISSVAATAAGTKVKVKTTVSIKFNSGSGPYYEQASFNGKVKASKGKCKKNRKVKIVNDGNGDVVGKAVSANNGNYETGVDNSFVGGDDYFAKVKKATYKKKHKKIICKKATSKVITAG